MNLHHPVLLRVVSGAGNGEHRLVGIRLRTGNRLSRHRFLKGPCGSLIVPDIHAVIQSVIGTQTAVRSKIFDPVAKRRRHILRTADFPFCHRRQSAYVLRKPLFLNIHGLVRSKRRQYPDLHGAVGSNLLMPAKIIAGIVRRTDSLHMKLPHQASCRTSLQHRIALVVDLVRIVRRQRILNAKHPLKLQMAPVIERIADKARQDGRISAEFLPRPSLPGDLLLRYAAGPHLPPLIMIRTEPEFGDRIEPAVPGDLPRIDVTVIVNDRQLLRHLVVQPFCRRRCQ